MKKKIIATLLTLVMVTAVVSGCGNQNASPSVTEQKEEETEAVAEEENDTAVADDTADDSEEEKLSENNLAGWSIVITALASCGIVLYVNKKNKKLQAQIDEIKNSKKK